MKSIANGARVDPMSPGKVFQSLGRNEPSNKNHIQVKKIYTGLLMSSSIDLKKSGSTKAVGANGKLETKNFKSLQLNKKRSH